MNDDEDTVSTTSIPYFENNREDAYSEEDVVGHRNYTSVYTSVYADPATKNKKYISRIDPETGYPVLICLHPSPTTPNSVIRHAQTGSLMYNNANKPYRVGTEDEHLFFTTSFATGELGQDTINLFYDSPEQCERHLFISVNEEVKTNWRIKRDAVLRKKTAVNAERLARQSVVVK